MIDTVATLQRIPFEEIPLHQDRINQLTLSSYPEFILHDGVAQKYWDVMYPTFPDFQNVWTLENEVICVANAVPLHLESFDTLPDGGWDFALENSIEQKRNGVNPNCLIALSVCINKRLRGSGVAQHALTSFKESARSLDLKRLFIPVRPSGKRRHPDIDFEHYITLKDSDGRYADRWIDLHYSVGGRFKSVCGNSMVITGSVAEWENWIGRKITESGIHHFDESLGTLEIDISQNSGTYREKNIWIEHPL